MTAAEPAAVAANRWVVGTTETRSAAKWIIASLATAAVAIFGAGPIISRPELSWRDDSVQLLVAAGFGAAGLSALVVLIGMIGSILAPEKITLDTMPATFVKELNAAQDRFPAGITTYKEFLKHCHETRQIVAQLPDEIARLEQEDPEVARRVKPQLEGMLRTATSNLEVYRSTAQNFLDEAAYTKLNQRFIGNKWLVVGLAVVASLGALGFQLSLASKKDPAADTKAAAAGPAGVSYLVKLPNTASAALWDALSLEKCANGSGEVPVLKQGTGSDTDPFVVTTIATSTDCKIQTFTVVSDVVVVRDPQPSKIVVDYTPTSPPPSTSPATTRLPKPTP